MYSLISKLGHSTNFITKVICTLSIKINDTKQEVLSRHNSTVQEAQAGGLNEIKDRLGQSELQVILTGLQYKMLSYTDVETRPTYSYTEVHLCVTVFLGKELTV